MATYLEILNRARNRQASSDISLLGIGDGSGDSIQGIAAVRNAVATLHEASFSWDFDERIENISTTVGNSILQSPGDTWETNVIKALKYQRPGDDRLSSLRLCTYEDFQDIMLTPLASNEPQFWAVNNMTVYIWPIPQAAYQITAIYSKIYPNITVDNINSVVMLPDSTLTTLEKGVYAYLREQIGDPVAPALLEEYKSQIGIQAQRNKHTYKRRNYNIFRVRPRRGDRKL